MKSTSVEMFHLRLLSLLTIPAQSQRQRQRWIVDSCWPLLLNLNSSSCHNILTFGNKSSNECLIQFKKHSMAMWRAAVSWHLLILNLDLTLTIVLASPAALTLRGKAWNPWKPRPYCSPLNSNQRPGVERGCWQWVSRGCLKQKAIELTKWSSVESKSLYPTSVRMDEGRSRSNGGPSMARL